MPVFSINKNKGIALSWHKITTMLCCGLRRKKKKIAKELISLPVTKPENSSRQARIPDIDLTMPSNTPQYKANFGQEQEAESMLTGSLSTTRPQAARNAKDSPRKQPVNLKSGDFKSSTSHGSGSQALHNTTYPAQVSRASKSRGRGPQDLHNMTDIAQGSIASKSRGPGPQAFHNTPELARKQTLEPKSSRVESSRSSGPKPQRPEISLGNLLFDPIEAAPERPPTPPSPPSPPLILSTRAAENPLYPDAQMPPGFTVAKMLNTIKERNIRLPVERPLRPEEVTVPGFPVDPSTHSTFEAEVARVRARGSEGSTPHSSFQNEAASTRGSDGSIPTTQFRDSLSSGYGPSFLDRNQPDPVIEGENFTALNNAHDMAGRGPSRLLDGSDMTEVEMASARRQAGVEPLVGGAALYTWDNDELVDMLGPKSSLWNKREVRQAKNAKKYLKKKQKKAEATRARNPVGWTAETPKTETFHRFMDLKQDLRKTLLKPMLVVEGETLVPYHYFEGKVIKNADGTPGEVRKKPQMNLLLALCSKRGTKGSLVLNDAQNIL